MMKYLVLLATIFLVACSAPAPSDDNEPDLGQKSQSLTLNQFCNNYPVVCQNWCDNHPVACGYLCELRPSLNFCSVECADLDEPCEADTDCCDNNVCGQFTGLCRPPTSSCVGPASPCGGSTGQICCSGLFCNGSGVCEQNPLGECSLEDQGCSETQPCCDDMSLDCQEGQCKLLE